MDFCISLLCWTENSKDCCCFVRLSWEVTGVMLADTVDGYRKKEKCLISDFKHCTAFHHIDHVLKGMDGGIVHWVERGHPRK